MHLDLSTILFDNEFSQNRSISLNNQIKIDYGPAQKNITHNATDEIKRHLHCGCLVCQKMQQLQVQTIHRFFDQERDVTFHTFIVAEKIVYNRTHHAEPVAVPSTCTNLPGLDKVQFNTS